MDLKFLHRISMLSVVLIVLACNPTAKIAISNVHDIKSIPSGSKIYGLPQTIVDVTVYAEELRIIPGPYHEFAEKYLSIENAPSTERRTWNISDVKLSLHTEVDPDYVYFMDQAGSLNQYPDIEKLLEDSMILLPVDFGGKALFYNTLPYREDDIHYFDLSVKRNFDVEDSEVIVSEVLPGTDADIRLSSAEAEEKTLERKAEEAANFIIKLRKRRFKLVAGQYDYMPEGIAMIEALKQLDKTEEEYLSLFTGRRITRKYKQTFHFTPGNNINDERAVLLRFSDTEGFVDARGGKGKPVMIEMTNGNKTSGLEGVAPSISTRNKLIIYRIPDQAYCKLFYGEELIVDAYLPVYQYGKVVTLEP